MNCSYKSVKNLLLLLLLTGFSLTINAQNAWINEIHYDNVSTDVNEIIEVVIENPGEYTLSLFQVILYNGNGGVTYTPTYNLSEFTVGNTIGNFTIYYKNYTSSTGIQNGAPDGLVLVYNNSVISGQFLSYEGSFTATNGIALGMTSVNIGVDEEPVPAAGLSLQLSGAGSQYSDFTWQEPTTATDGALNNGQTLATGGVGNPENFNAITISQTQINLSWLQNENLDDVMIATNTTNSFGTPSGTYEVDDLIGTATVIYIGPFTSFSHTGLPVATEQFYKAWSVDVLSTYSTGVVDSATTQFLEPTGHPTDLTATSNGPVYITVSWTDSDAAHYLIKGSTVGYENIVPPVDGVGQGDSPLIKNVDASIQLHQFTGLTPNTQHYFKIWPYNGGGESSNYKTDGTVPEATATTDELDINAFISEVADPRDSSLAKFIEIYNPGPGAIDFATAPVYICRQSNGGTTWGSYQLSGNLAADDNLIVSYVFSPSLADTLRFFNAYGFEADFYNSSINGNGNDGYFLFYGGNQNSGTMIDAFGFMDEDGTNTLWDYEDKKAVRKRNVTGPNANWIASEWVILADTAKAKDMTPGFHKGNVSWVGPTSTNWNAKGLNWDSPYGYIPDASCIVTIPNVANYPIVTEPSACHQVQIQSGSTLSVQSTGSLLIVGP